MEKEIEKMSDEELIKYYDNQKILSSRLRADTIDVKLSKQELLKRLNWKERLIEEIKKQSDLEDEYMSQSKFINNVIIKTIRNFELNQ